MAKEKTDITDLLIMTANRLSDQATEKQRASENLLVLAEFCEKQPPDAPLLLGITELLRGYHPEH